jgi:RNA exonuclease 4
MVSKKRIDYRPSWLGRSFTILGLRVAPKFVDIQERVAKIIKNKILVGHRIWDFLSVGVLLKMQCFN